MFKINDGQKQEHLIMPMQKLSEMMFINTGNYSNWYKPWKLTYAATKTKYSIAQLQLTCQNNNPLKLDFNVDEILEIARRCELKIVRKSDQFKHLVFFKDY